MKNGVKIIYFVFSISLLYYVALPNLGFPNYPTGSLQSYEPADSENINRRAYFSNQDRESVVNHYKNDFSIRKSFLTNFLQLRLNYPPEESQTIIRDQTRSSYLEEITYPLRESVFINGFMPSVPKDAIIIENKNWLQKITVKYVSSNIYVRIFVVLMLIIISPFLIKSLNETMVLFYIEYKRIKLSIVSGFKLR